MREVFELYRKELDRVELTENEKTALVRTLSEREPERKPARPARVVRTALIAACMCLALVGTVFAATEIMAQVKLMDGGTLYTWFDEEGHEIFTWDDTTSSDTSPVELRDGRLWFVAGGQEKDITDLVDEDTPYIYTKTLEDGRLSHMIVGGTPENYGYAMLVFRKDGTVLGVNGDNFSWKEILKEGELEPVTITEDDVKLFVVTGEASVTHWQNWMTAAAEQLGISGFLADIK